MKFRVAASLLLAVFPTLAFAANTNVNGGQPSPAARAQAEMYARQLIGVISFVEMRYVRPVERAALVQAAIAGIYEVVREPLPAGLGNDLVRARSLREFEYVLRAARERLGDVENLRDQRAVFASLRALPRVLDPYCGVPSSTELRRSQSTEPYFGLGIEFDLAQELPVNNFDFDVPAPTRGSQPGPYRIANILPGSPAQRAGLRPGDLLTHVAGQATAGEQGPALLRRLTFFGNEGRAGQLALSVKRVGHAEPITVSLTAGAFTPEWVFGARRDLGNSWSFMLDPVNKIGYVRMGFIDYGAPAQLESALRDLKGNGLKGLLVDLRDCPGGYVDPAVEITSMFVKSGDIATVRDRGQGQQRYQTNGRYVPLGDVPILVLVNGATMGGGEMIAAALQDHSIAKVCGQRTFGKGSVQRTQAVSDVGYQFKLTTGLFTRPNGKNLQRFPDTRPDEDWGVRPDTDYEFPLLPDLQVELKEWQAQFILRPGSSRDPLPLDDPENDPLRQFAVRALRKLMK